MRVCDECDTKIILWDLGNVFIQGVHGPLFDLTYNRNSKFRDRSLFDQGIYKIINESFYGKIDLEYTWKSIQNYIGMDDKDFIEIRSSVRINNYNEDLIRKIQRLSKKYKFGILSDLSQIGYSVVKENIKHFIDLCDPDLVFISIFYGLTKLKDKQLFFKLALEKIDLNPGEVLFVDDNEKLVQTARSLGMKGIVYQRNQSDTSWKETNEKLWTNLAKMNIVSEYESIHINKTSN